MFIDLDDFKSINDMHGHPAGDKVLQTIAGRLKKMTRADDTVSRHGGDEFLYLLLELKDERDAIQIAEKIIRTLSEPCDIGTGDPALSRSVRPSIGISLFPKHGDTADALVRSADKAMYSAKRDGSGYSFA